MLLRYAVLLLCLNLARTEVTHFGKGAISDVDDIFSLWPSIHNGVRLMRLRKREVDIPKPELPATTLKPVHAPEQAAAQSAGQTALQQPAQQSEQVPAQEPVNPPAQDTVKPSPQQSETPKADKSNETPKNDKPKEEHPETNDIKVPVNPVINVTLNANGTEVKSDVNATATSTAPKINLSDPGVVKRAFIVFGGFALLGTAYYFIFYRKKNSNNNAKDTHSSIDPNQFRYGVLQSEDKRNNLELSRVPLTMESDEDDDEDLEIFDLGQKKKSLSYINLEQHDDDIVLNDSRSIDMENLLVDIAQ